MLSYSQEEIRSKEKDILGAFPNTYVFAKHLCEKILRLRRGNMPMTICRPSIIGCAWKEPEKGYTDSMAATGIVLLGIGFGLIHYMKY